MLVELIDFVDFVDFVELVVYLGLIDLLDLVETVDGMFPELDAVEVDVPEEALLLALDLLIELFVFVEAKLPRLV